MRIPAQVVCGIVFLGAGVFAIDSKAKGLNTAAMILGGRNWSTS